MATNEIRIPPAGRFRWVGDYQRPAPRYADHDPGDEHPRVTIGPMWTCLPAFTDLGENYYDRDRIYRSKPRTFAAYCSAPAGVRCACRTPDRPVTNGVTEP